MKKLFLSLICVFILASCAYIGVKVHSYRELANAEPENTAEDTSDIAMVRVKSSDGGWLNLEDISFSSVEDNVSVAEITYNSGEVKEKNCYIVISSSDTAKEPVVIDGNYVKIEIPSEKGES